MFLSQPFQRRKRIPFGEGSLRADDDHKRFNIRDQNEVLKEFLNLHKDAVKEITEGHPDDINPITKTFLCGRVRIDVPILPQDVIPDLICEECEKELASVKCEACNQVFCEKCLDLCHQKNWSLNIPHEHYRNESIREIMVGDTSRVDLSRPYCLPEYECYDTELRQHKDIENPYTLAVPNSLRHQKMTVPLIKPKFKVGDTVLYTDYQSPTPDKPVFGTIVSEWDFRHGDSAPTITRGQDSVMWYVIRRLDEEQYYDPYEDDEMEEREAADGRSVDGRSISIASQGSAAESATGSHTSSVLTSGTPMSRPGTGLIASPQKLKGIPVLEGVTDVPLRYAMQMAKEVNKKASLATQIKVFGSKLHFSSIFTARPTSPTRTAPTSESHDDISLLSQESSRPNGAMSTQQLHMLRSREVAEQLNNEIDLENASLLSSAVENNVGPKKRNEVSETLLVVAALEEKGANILSENGSKLPASKRSYYHVFEDEEVRFAALDRSGSWDWSRPEEPQEPHDALAEDMLKILVMPENEIFEPKEYFKRQIAQKQLVFKGIVKKAFVKIFSAQLQNAFQTWLDMMHDEIFEEETLATVVIQTAARRWLCRNVLRDIREAIQRELERRRAMLHSSFKYSSLDGQRHFQLFTLDNKRFFETRRDMNRYALHLRIEVSKVMYFLNIRRKEILAQAIGRWKGLLYEAFLESSLQHGHVLPYADNEFALARQHGFDEMRNTWREEIAAEMTLDEYRSSVGGIHKRLNDAFKQAMTLHQETNGAVLGRGADDTDLHILAVPVGLPLKRADNEEFPSELRDANTSIGQADVVPPFHPTIALRVKPKDLTTGCAGGYSTTRSGELIFSNDDHGVSSASEFVNCVTLDSSFSVKTSVGSVSRIGKDGTVSRMNPKDNRLINAQPPEPKVGLRRSSLTAPPPTAAPDSHLLKVLPPLPVIPVSQDSEGNLAVSSQNKPRYNSLRSRLEGPTEYSCWIIPGILAMGNVPVGRAWRRRQVKTSVHTRIDAVSQLILSGISTFVSLLPLEDEAIGERRCPLPLSLDPQRGGLGLSEANIVPGTAVESRFNDSVKQCRFELKSVVSSFKSQIENWNADIQLNVVDDPLDMRYAASLKEDLRLRARRAISMENMDVAKKELAQLPDIQKVSCEFIRMPIVQDSAPDLNDFLPLLWELERRIMAGERLYIYSLEGHGRCGLVCGSLLGRLYGLKPREALFRMQVYHDSIHSQVRRLVPVNCPQLINQQELLASVLRNTNRVFDGTTLRSQLDPETYVIEQHHLERGSQIGVYGVSVVEQVEKRSVPTTYHSPGGKSQKTWTDIDLHSFDAIPTEEEQELSRLNTLASTSARESRRQTSASGGYSKKGLSLRNSQSFSMPSTLTISEAAKTENSNPKAAGKKQSRRSRRSRRARDGSLSCSGEDDVKTIAIDSLGQHHPHLHPHHHHEGSHGGASSDPFASSPTTAVPLSPITHTKPRVAPNLIPSLRPAPAAAPKLPSIRSRYGDIA